MAEAGILEPGALKKFLQKTPLPDRDNTENLSQVRFDVEQLAFNAKLQSWVDSHTPIVSQSDSHELDDAQRLSVSESGSEGTSEETEAEMTSEADQVSQDPDRSRSSRGSKSAPHQQDQSAKANNDLVTVQPNGVQNNTMDTSPDPRISEVAVDLTVSKTVVSPDVSDPVMVPNQASLENQVVPPVTEPKVQIPASVSADPSTDRKSTTQAPAVTSATITLAVPVSSPQVVSQDKSEAPKTSGISHSDVDKAPTPMDEEPDHQGGHEVAMTIDEILKRGLVADPDWMRVRCRRASI